MIFEGDIVLYDLSAYGLDDVVVLRVNKVLDVRIVASHVNGEWPVQLQHWRWKSEETLTSDYVIQCLHRNYSRRSRYLSISV